MTHKTFSVLFLAKVIIIISLRCLLTLTLLSSPLRFPHTTEKPLKHFHDKTVLLFWWWDNKTSTIYYTENAQSREHSIHLMIFVGLVLPTRAIEIFMHDDHEMIKLHFCRARKRKPNDETFPLINGSGTAVGFNKISVFCRQIWIEVDDLRSLNKACSLV